MLAPATWLFVKDRQSVYIVRPPQSFVMIVHGPGSDRAQHEFGSERELQDFQVKLAEDLSRKGWLLWAFDRDRRMGADRRSAPRPDVTDRRRR
jgi:hypothetical protein